MYYVVKGFVSWFCHADNWTSGLKIPIPSSKIHSAEGTLPKDGVYSLTWGSLDWNIVIPMEF